MGKEGFKKLFSPENNSREAGDNKESSRGDMRELTEEERSELRKTLDKALRSRRKRK